MPSSAPAPPCRNMCAFDAQGGYSCGGAGVPQPSQARPQRTAFVTREGFYVRPCCTKDAAKCDEIQSTIKRVACKASCDTSC